MCVCVPERQRHIRCGCVAAVKDSLVGWEHSAFDRTTVGFTKNSIMIDALMSSARTEPERVNEREREQVAIVINLIFRCFFAFFACVFPFFAQLRVGITRNMVKWSSTGKRTSRLFVCLLFSLLRRSLFVSLINKIHTHPSIYRTLLARRVYLLFSFGSRLLFFCLSFWSLVQLQSLVFRARTHTHIVFCYSGDMTVISIQLKPAFCTSRKLIAIEIRK